MSVISDYLSALKRQYPNTQDVREQLEELRDTLHIKAEEYQSQGLNYNDAAKAAIDSLGDVTPLLEEVAGNVKKVYVNRLNRNNALFCSLIILCEIVGGTFLFLYVSSSVAITFEAFYYGLAAVIFGTSVWPIIAFIQYRNELKRIEVIRMAYKKLLRTALFSWIAISLFLFVINIFTDTTVIWSVLPMIGIATWPINIFLYHRQLMGGRYDAA